MTDDTTSSQPPPGSGQNPPLVVPSDVAAKFGDLVALIKASESMNDEERQYWINILPIMTPEQVGNLRSILENERSQLAAIDAKYAQEMHHIEEKELVHRTDEERRQQRSSRTAAESSAKRQEERTAEDILRKIEGAPS